MQEEKEHCLDADGRRANTKKEPSEKTKTAQSGTESRATSRLIQPFVEKLHEITVGPVVSILVGQRDELAASEFQFATENS